jgi:UDP-N-acetylmuramoylalanine--D-glutamate ligase
MADLPWSCALVVGMGASGRAAAQLLSALGVQTRLYDRKAEAPEAAWAEGLPYFHGEDVPAEAISGIDLLILSPGVPPRPVRALQETHAPQAEVHGELSLALEVLSRHAGDAMPPLCLITGTNGKSTITALTAHLLEAGGATPFAGGNLGPAVSDLVRGIVLEGAESPSHLVLECSSYQLETLRELPTAVAMICNISPDHLARYDSMEHYATTKTEIFKGLGEGGLALLDAENDWTAKLRPTGRVELVTDAGLDFVDGQLRVGDQRFDRQSLRAAGRHNAKNALFALRAALELGASPEDCRAGLASFEGLAHRMAFVREHEGIAYYNDSKATNVASVLAGLQGFERRFVLIAGGQLKGEDLSELITLVRDEGIAMVAIGRDRKLLCDAARDQIRCECLETLEEGFARARELAVSGQAVVLSPAAASWDQYSSFKARGEHFEALARAL